MLVTGASGFIGSAVTRLLLEEGRSVSVLVRPGSSPRGLEDVRDELRWIEADLLRPDDIQRAIEELSPDACIHCAWYVDARDYVTSSANYAFVGGTVGLAVGLARAGCRRLVGVGTCYEYAPTQGARNEGDPTSPATPYAAAKLAVADFLPELSTAGMSTAWARLFWLYGPYEKPSRLVPSVVLSLLAGRSAHITVGDQLRDFLHVDDVAAALVRLTDSSLSGPVNVGSGSPVTVRHVAESIKWQIGGAGSLVVGARAAGHEEPEEIWADNSLLRSTGWKQRLSLEDGLARTIEWWRGELARRASGADERPAR